jgi:hypothetical protein
MPAEQQWLGRRPTGHGRLHVPAVAAAGVDQVKPGAAFLAESAFMLRPALAK